LEFRILGFLATRERGASFFDEDFPTNIREESLLGVKRLTRIGYRLQKLPEVSFSGPHNLRFSFDVDERKSAFNSLIGIWA